MSIFKLSCFWGSLHIDDLIKAFEIGILNPNLYNRTFNIGGYKPITNIELFKLAAKLLDKQRFFIKISPSLIILALKILSVFKVNIISIEQVLRFQENKDISIQEFIDAFDFTPKDIRDVMKVLAKKI